ncbi:MAG: manganese efflux pump MntP family protein [Treponemataceae bacterium]
MSFVELIFLAIGLSMDAFAVSVCKGLGMKKANLKAGLTCGIWFGGFQALMPLIGFFVGRLFAEMIQAIDHWIAFTLLAFIGVNMIRETLTNPCCCTDNESDEDMSFKTMFLLAIATSIDALAVGISLAMIGNVNILQAIVLIGVVTCLLCTVGVKIGNLFGSKLKNKAQILGGSILILLGVKILLEHLEIFT